MAAPKASSTAASPVSKYAIRAQARNLHGKNNTKNVDFAMGKRSMRPIVRPIVSPRTPRRQATQPKEKHDDQARAFVRFEAKPGKENAVADFLATRPRALRARTATTPIWFALRLSPTTFGVFDAFHMTKPVARRYLAGPIAQA
jgi:hypothetical protein